uniref:Extensin-like n=1 Tax=Meloidogyne hapla TaxID=6305 RepID=A0A1I8BQF8_MELHA
MEDDSLEQIRNRSAKRNLEISKMFEPKEVFEESRQHVSTLIHSFNSPGMASPTAKKSKAHAPIAPLKPMQLSFLPPKTMPSPTLASKVMPSPKTTPAPVVPQKVLPSPIVPAKTVPPLIVLPTSETTSTVSSTEV